MIGKKIGEFILNNMYSFLYLFVLAAVLYVLMFIYFFSILGWGDYNCGLFHDYLSDYYNIFMYTFLILNILVFVFYLFKRVSIGKVYIFLGVSFLIQIGVFTYAAGFLYDGYVKIHESNGDYQLVEDIYLKYDHFEWRKRCTRPDAHKYYSRWPDEYMDILKKDYSGSIRVKINDSVNLSLDESTEIRKKEIIDLGGKILGIEDKSMNGIDFRIIRYSNVHESKKYYGGFFSFLTIDKKKEIFVEVRGSDMKTLNEKLDYHMNWIYIKNRF